MNPPIIVAPASLDELEDALVHADGARVVGGGTIEVPRWHAEGFPRLGVCVSALPELRSRGADRCGAGRTLAELAADRDLPRLLRDTAAGCATPAVRTLATLGGNLAARRPGCVAVALLALDSTVTVLRPGRGLIQVRLADLARRGPEADPRLPEVIVGAGWDVPADVGAVHRLTLQARSGPVLATVAVAGRRRGGLLRWTVAAGGTGVPPQRLGGTERLLDGAATPHDVAAAASRELTVRPSVALRGEEDYQRHLVGVLVGRAVEDAMAGPL